jgi:ribonuclease HII
MKFVPSMVIGVDEAGRGPLAGPVAVGTVMAPHGFDVAKEFPGVADSKAISVSKREKVFAMLEARAAAGDVRYLVGFGDAGRIDREGIAVVIRGLVSDAANALAPDAERVEILLDGALRAPGEYRQQTIIGGDASVPIISLASIAAKVMRDRLMCRAAEEYPAYGFERHKGYGTKHHYEMLQKHGPCGIHRRTYLHFTKASLVV